MGRINPWNSEKENVYHNYLECGLGAIVESQFVRQGTGGKRLCKECNRLGNKGLKDIEDKVYNQKFPTS